MAILDKSKRLKKELTLLNVYAIATGTTLSAGFFLLPGLAYQQAGPAMILSYLLAAIPLIPAMLCMMELATAMPRAGGTYYFLDRSMGPLVGTIGGIGTWLTLVLKTAFALIGMGAYLALFLSGTNMIFMAVILAVIFGIINLVGAKESASLQMLLVSCILILLGGFLLQGTMHMDFRHFDGFFDAGGNAILATTGLVYISFIGVTKIASISEEVKNPERNLPLGMFLAFGTALIVYALGTYVMVGVLPPEQLSGNLTPVAAAAEHMVGTWGKVLVTIAAIFAFSSVANAGILSASRYPLAMSRDHMLPRNFKHLNHKGNPNISIIFTAGAIIVSLVLFDPTKIAKLASSFQLIMFALCCLAVIIMRESHIEAYDPGYRAPFYPWLQIVGIVTPMFLIIEMGWLTILFSFALIAVGTLWYFYYARNRISRGGAIYHVFERLGKERYEGLEPELRGILKEKGLRDYDPFDELVTQAQVIDLKASDTYANIVGKASEMLANELSVPSEKLFTEFMQGTKIGATPVSKGVALPHLRLNEIRESILLLVRSKPGVRVEEAKRFWGEHMPEETIHAVFFLISPEGNPGQHLRILANIASRVDDEGFLEEWLKAAHEQDLKEILLRDEHFVSIKLKPKTANASWIGKMIKEIDMTENCLVAIIRRKGGMIVPRGNTVLNKNDHLTIIGDPSGIKKFREIYCR